MMGTLIWEAIQPFLGKIIGYGIVAVVVSGALLYAKIHYEDIGYQKAITEINQANERANQNAQNARSKVDDCFASGRTWDVARGVCVAQ